MSGGTIAKPSRGRRIRYAVQTSALLFAVTACCVFAVVLADRFPRRLDVTATREHELSPRTLQLIGDLKDRYEIVVAANFASLDSAGVRRTQDVLDNFARASANIKVTTIDVASSHGIAELDALLARLLDRYKPALEAQRAGLDGAVTKATLSVDSLHTLSDDLLRTRTAVTDSSPNADALRRFLEDSAASCRISAKELEDSLARVRDRATATVGKTVVPAGDDASADLRKALSGALSQLSRINDGLDALAKATDAQVPQAVRESARTVADRAATLRSELGMTITGLDALPRTPIGTLARALERSSVAVVIGPPGSARSGLMSVDLSSLFPAKPAPGVPPSQIDLRARTEELLAGALASLSRADAPIVVLVHGESQRFAPEFAPFSSAVERLRMRGCDVLEWAPALDADPPAITPVDPGGKRPIVYVTIATAANTQEGAARAAKLAATVGKLITAGKQLLISVNPSTLPGSGQKDPMTEFLIPLGISADTARPLLQQALVGGKRVVSADLFIADPHTDHPIAAAIRGLNVRLPWAVPVRIGLESSGITPIITVDNAGQTVWAESEWVEFRRTPAAQRSQLVNPPANDSSRDDGVGPWTLAAAVQRSAGGGSQRLLIVGCNGWFLDEITQGSTIVDGRPVLYNPGNMELLDAGISWLAGQEGAISVSAQARSAPLIPAMPETLMTTLRWTLIGGLPVLILLIGALWRLVRG